MVYVYIPPKYLLQASPIHNPKLSLNCLAYSLLLTTDNINTNKHTYIHTHIHTYTHTYTHTSEFIRREDSRSERGGEERDCFYMKHFS